MIALTVSLMQESDVDDGVRSIFRIHRPDDSDRDANDNLS
jgi:hypothetical protein